MLMSLLLLLAVSRINIDILLRGSLENSLYRAVMKLLHGHSTGKLS